jgi:hypothetical protein
VIALLFALCTIVPNRANFAHPANTCSPPSPTNFGWIANQDSAAYIQHALASSTKELNEDLARVIHGKSTWARKKFQRLYFATLATTVGVVAAVAAIVIELSSWTINGGTGVH